MSALDQEHWGRLWERGLLTSLPEGFAVNYDGEIAEFWNTHFARLSGGAAVLDVCTGNGAVAVLAAEYAGKHDLGYDVVATDAAAIHPGLIKERYPELAPAMTRIRFLPKTPFEQLDLPDESFELVTSQFGIEYCDWEQAARQVHRLLKPGGSFACITHSGSSDLVEFMEAEAEQSKLLKRLGFVDGLRDLLDGRSSFTLFQSIVRTALARMEEERERAPAEFLDGICKTLSTLDQAGEASVTRHYQRLDELHRRLTDSDARSRDLLRVGQALRDHPDWYRVFTDVGLELMESGEMLYAGERRIGQFYYFVKSVG